MCVEQERLCTLDPHSNLRLAQLLPAPLTRIAHQLLHRPPRLLEVCQLLARQDGGVSTGVQQQLAAAGVSLGGGCNRCCSSTFSRDVCHTHQACGQYRRVSDVLQHLLKQLRICCKHGMPQGWLC